MRVRKATSDRRCGVCGLKQGKVEVFRVESRGSGRLLVLCGRCALTVGKQLVEMGYDDGLVTHDPSREVWTVENDPGPPRFKDE